MRLCFDFKLLTSNSEFLFSRFFWQLVMLAFGLCNVIACKFVFVVLDIRYFLHLHAKLADFDQLANCLSNSDHLVVVCSHDAHLDAPS